MRIIRDLRQISRPLPGAVMTIGNFDGIHLGHREIFRRVVTGARKIGGTSVVFTFVPHPLKVLAPEKAPRLINTTEEKERLIEASCIDVLIAAPFTREFAALPAGSFVKEVLVDRIGLRRLVVGYDYAFGRGREGNVDFLRARGRELGFEVEVLGPIRQGGEVYSSTGIRQQVEAGEVREVVRSLGRHYSLEGVVVHGAKRGKGLGFPTANLVPDKDLLPRAGVYAVKVRRGETLLDGVANIGSNPTFDGRETGVEVHLLDFAGDLYGERLRVYFLERLRDERRFDGPTALKAAIAADVERARPLLAAARLVEYREYLGECEPAGGETG